MHVCTSISTVGRQRLGVCGRVELYYYYYSYYCYYSYYFQYHYCYNYLGGREAETKGGRSLVEELSLSLSPYLTLSLSTHQVGIDVEEKAA